MTEPEFHRIRRLPPYVFAEVNRLKAAARAAGKDIIDLGMGNPDSPTPAHIVEKLVETVRDGKTHRYSTSRGIPGLRKAWAGYYARRFGVQLDPETQVCVTLGSKEGLANLAQAITAPGDTILTPNPSYPIHPFGFIIAGASIRHVPFGPGIDLMRELARAAEHSVPAPTMVVLELPLEPDRAHLRPRLLQGGRGLGAPARDLAAVRHRLRRDLLRRPAAAVDPGGARRLRRRDRVRLAVQDLLDARLADRLRRRQHAAGRRADPDQVLPRLRRLHPGPGGGDRRAQRPAGLRARAFASSIAARRDVLVDGLAKAGWQVPKPDATMFCWAPVPEPFRELGSLGFAKLLLEEAEVAVAPGIGFGEYGEGYVRLALVENRHRLRQAVRNIRSLPGPARQRRRRRGAGGGMTRRRRRCGSASPASAPSAPARSGCCATRPSCWPTRTGRPLTRDRGQRPRPRPAPRGLDLAGVRWHDDARGAGRGPRGRPRLRADRRQRRRGARSGPRGARGAAGPWSPPTRRCWPCTAPSWRGWPRAAGAAAALRGRGRGRHPDHQVAARGAGRQPDPAASTASSTAPATSS